MHLTPTTMRTAAWSAFILSTASAQHVLDTLSFGHKGDTVSPNLRGVPHWHINGDGYIPNIMSDRVVLTPPWPGNAKGSMWSEETVPFEEWAAELHFRASGPERGVGNLQLWYTKESQKDNGATDLDKSSKFDGLVLLVDQYGGHGGTIRGFLNDGTISFKDHHDPDTLSFGQCNYAYRNVGRFSVLKVRQASGEFEVTIDGNPCFKTNKLHLPSNYYFGISASSGENPDSFEAHKFLVSTTNSNTREEPGSPPKRAWQHAAEHQQKQLEQQQQQQNQPRQPPREPTIGEIPQMLSDVLAGNIRNQEDQFADLHNRIQIINHRVNDIYDTLDHISRTMDQRHNEVMNRVVPSHDRTDAVVRNVEKIERVVMAIQRDLESKDYKDMLTAVHNAVHDSHHSLTQDLPQAMGKIVTTHGPKTTHILFYFVAIQVTLFGAWQLYKKRRSTPKKYL
ncbi:concanavalin A-like lectin/glucanase [Delitschia confertaspora ATCC 74209]|uniref:Concanavalin A-like lectin/glucanase n=1 Tax=Delitschia confertaspora ATCC 74209 TaxID=1513339 RepID=A0A9P4JF62_9PLEO|nr:concanavalin A-like lectin/glucanase [Delitschia confertaspora ATCC 74209]